MPVRSVAGVANYGPKAPSPVAVTVKQGRLSTCWAPGQPHPGPSAAPLRGCAPQPLLQCGTEAPVGPSSGRAGTLTAGAGQVRRHWPLAIAEVRPFRNPGLDLAVLGGLKRVLDQMMDRFLPGRRQARATLSGSGPSAGRAGPPSCGALDAPAPPAARQTQAATQR